jgi:hypothetical protein
MEAAATVRESCPTKEAVSDCLAMALHVRLDAERGGLIELKRFAPQ